MIFVTGGTGLLGSYLLRELVARGKKVTALYRNEIPQTGYSNQVHWIQGDIHDIVLLEEIMLQAKQVYHCAATVSFNPKKKYELLKVNAEGTANIVNAALRTGIQKLVHVSSVSAMGRKRDGMQVTEETKWEEESNNSNYGRSKYFAELEVWRGISEGLNAVIVNPTFILGAGNWETGSAAMFKKAWKQFPWYTEGVSGFVDAADVAKAMILLMESNVSNERFIISAENWPFKKVFTEMALAFNKKPPHKKASPYMAGLLWRIEKMRSFFTGSEPLLTKEAVDTAQRKVYFDSSKLMQVLPHFSYKPLQRTIKEYCNVYQTMQ
ncbi:NAD-dependent epimerase/dehydratase family protein [Agriterribacter sp.]|uniref:NAD-dependent epimerase/dehydratase family protein n=1 Tax=Agriterribacter sp. TaxID=2821509 RepID=UPI002B7E8600|nr:NAD-dependent epimerase/dehydratase family protein [Agriterribacter sp.]HRP56444.1 NAD-dependent epimerase/dehydratase family protein [Agriterribacter sp.]